LGDDPKRKYGLRWEDYKDSCDTTAEYLEMKPVPPGWMWVVQHVAAKDATSDIDKLLTYWDQWGWHRVTYYGDYRRTAKHFAALAGFEVVEEA